MIAVTCVAFQAPGMVHLPSRSRSPLPVKAESPSQHPPSAYQITIDGQPAFLLPHLDAQHATLESGEACISKGERQYFSLQTLADADAVALDCLKAICISNTTSCV